MVPWNHEQGPLEPAQNAGRALVLVGEIAVREIAGRDHELGVDGGYEIVERRPQAGRLLRARMQVGHVENAHRPHLGRRL